MILAALQELYFDIYELWIWPACLYEPKKKFSCYPQLDV